MTQNRRTTARTTGTELRLVATDQPHTSTADGPAAPGRSRRPRKQSRASFGSVRRLTSGRYQARYSDAQGNRHTAPHTYATKREAENWLATQQADMARGTWRAPALGTIALADYAEDLLATRPELRPKTRATYDSLLRTLICTDLDLPAGRGRTRTVNLGQSEIGAIHLASIREWRTAALHRATQNAEQRSATYVARREREAVHHARTWGRQNGYPVKDTGRIPETVRAAWLAAGSPAAASLPGLAAPPSTTSGRTRVAQAYRLLHMVLEQAVQEGRILANPCQIARAGQPERTPARVPATPVEITALAAAMPERYAAAVHVAAWSGLRAGELFGLARRHVDLDAGTVRVERAVDYDHEHDRAPVMGPTKTTASLRTVALPPSVVAILADHMARFTGPDSDDLVFADPRGRIAPRSVRGVTFRRARAQIGRPDLRWHDLRHTGATLAAQAGATISELQARIGHSTYAAAMRYQSASSQRDRELALRLDLLAQTAGGAAGAGRQGDHGPTDSTGGQR